jgi:hypothetical protein
MPDLLRFLALLALAVAAMPVSAAAEAEADPRDRGLPPLMRVEPLADPASLGGTGHAAEAEALPGTAPRAPVPMPRPEAHATAPAARPGPGWTLRTVPDGTPLALAGGPGIVASLSAFCLGGRPWLALDLAPVPEADAVRADFGFSAARIEATALREEGAGGAYVIELGAGDLARLLAGADTSASLAIDGSQQGPLSLAGSTRAIRAALADCHAF